MKIIYHHRTQGEEPESIHIMAIVNALRKLGHEVTLVGPSKRELKTSAPRMSRLAAIKRQLPSLVFEILQIGYNAISFIQLCEIIRKTKPDLIYERYALYNFSGIIAARIYSVPLILEVNTPYAHAWAKYYKIHFPWLAKKVESWILGAANRVITVTQAQREFLMQHYPQVRDVSVCHNAIEPQDFKLDIEPFLLPLPYSDLQTSIVVGFVGTMNRWQGIPVFKEVIPRVIEANPHVIFLLVGDGEFRPELEFHLSQCGVSDRVFFTGRVGHETIPSLVKCMDIAVLPDSNVYGSPMKVFEYMAMGKAIIAPRVPPVEEIMADGQNGIIIERCDSAAMTEKILLLAGDKQLRDTLGARARAYVMSNHTWASNAMSIMDLYQDICQIREL